MSVRRVLVVGSGKRVREAALPAFLRLRDDFKVERVLARTAKRIAVEGAAFDVEAFDAFGPGDLAGVDVVYAAVAKDAVPAVLARFAQEDRSRATLLIDTPVLRFRHMARAPLLEGWKAASVTEDCAFLPWFDVVDAFRASGDLGEPRQLVLRRSGYAYHAVAMAKRLLDVRRVASGRRVPKKGREATRVIGFAGGREAVVVEPRDYAVGEIELIGSSGSVTDVAHGRGGGSFGGHEPQRLLPIALGERCTGFRIGDVERALDPDEIELAAGDPEHASVTARMDAMKRVGFLRLLRRVAAGDEAWPLVEALDDMVVDYQFEKLGRVLPWWLVGPRTACGRLILRSLTRFGS